MANAADDSNGYGGGAGGKFRKRPFRKSVTTPYDRPVTALRNTSSNISNGGSSGWISKIVDPASKLISASAHKLFSSVFRKRLLPHREPAPGSIDNNVESPENHFGDELMDDCSRIQRKDKNEGVAELEQDRNKKERETLSNGPVTDGVSELERILNQKTFTRSEIDHLSKLLQSRTVEKSSTAQKGRFELTPYEPPVAPFRQELSGNSSELPGVDLTTAVRSKFNNDEIASPAELAKAYMGSRSTVVSPYTFAPHAQPVREENHALTRYQSHSPVMQIEQKPFCTPMKSQNELIIPRSRGRSAIYSMARTPYSRAITTETKGLVTSNSCFTGQCVSTQQKVLKRRSSVLENDIGTVGPIRRIRQKSNLSYTKSLGQSSHTPLTHIIASEIQEDRGDKGKSISNMHVSSKSIEMGQRILQQLEKMTPPKEKSSDKKSLKYVQNGQVSGKNMDSPDAEKQDKVHCENGDVKIMNNGIMDTAPVVLKSAVGDDNRRLEVSSIKSNGNLFQENPSLPDSSKVNGSVFPELKSSSSLSLKNNMAEKGTDQSLPTSSVFNKETGSSAVSAQSMTSSMFSKPGIPASTISFGLSSSDKVSQASLFSPSVVESHSQLQNSHSDAGNKLPESTKSIEAVDLLKKSDSTATTISGTDTAGKLTAFGNSSNNSLPGAASSSLRNGGFQFGASTTLNTNSTVLGDQVLPSNTDSASATESQPAASPLSVSFGSSRPAVNGSSTHVTASFGSSSIFDNKNNGSTNSFGGNSQTTSSPVFGSPFNNNNSSSGPSFGASSPIPSFSFGASSTTTPAVFAFGASSSPAPSQPSFGNGSLGNNNQMKMEDTMVEDSKQPSLTSVPNPFQFGSQQNHIPPSSSVATPFQFSSQQNQAPAIPFQFNSQQNQAPAESNPFKFSSQVNPPQAQSPFQFSSQQNQTPPPQNPFQTSESSGGGGSFSLGASGNDKSARKIIRVRNRLRKK